MYIWRLQNFREFFWPLTCLVFGQIHSTIFTQPPLLICFWGPSHCRHHTYMPPKQKACRLKLLQNFDLQHQKCQKLLVKIILCLCYKLLPGTPSGTAPERGSPRRTLPRCRRTSGPAGSAARKSSQSPHSPWKKYKWDSQLTVQMGTFLVYGMS